MSSAHSPTPSSSTQNDQNSQMGNNRRGAPKQKGALRAKSGCYTCRIRRKKCDEKPDERGQCQTCVRLRLQCLGFGAKRPDWMREGNNVRELREKIKVFLAQNGMIKGHSASSRVRQSQPASPSSPVALADSSLRTTSSVSELNHASGSTIITRSNHTGTTPPPHSPDDSVSSLDTNDSQPLSNIPILDLSEGRALPSRVPSHGPIRSHGSRRTKADRIAPFLSGDTGAKRQTGPATAQPDSIFSTPYSQCDITGSTSTPGVGHGSPPGRVPSRSTPQLIPKHYDNNQCVYTNVNQCYANHPLYSPASSGPTSVTHPPRIISNHAPTQSFLPYNTSPASSSSSLHSGNIRNHTNYHTPFSLSTPLPSLGHDPVHPVPYVQSSGSITPSVGSHGLMSSSASTSETDPFSPRSDLLLIHNNTSAAMVDHVHVKSEPSDVTLEMDGMGLNDTSYHPQPGLDIDLNAISYPNVENVCTNDLSHNGQYLPPSVSTVGYSTYEMTSTLTNGHNPHNINCGNHLTHQRNPFDQRPYAHIEGTDGSGMGQTYGLEPQLSPDSPITTERYPLTGDIILGYPSATEVGHSPVNMTQSGYNHTYEQHSVQNVHSTPVESQPEWTNRDFAENVQDQTVSDEQLPTTATTTTTTTTAQGPSALAPSQASLRFIHRNNDGSPLQTFPQVNIDVNYLREGGTALQPCRQSSFGSIYNLNFDYLDQGDQSMFDTLPIGSNNSLGLHDIGFDISSGLAPEGYMFLFNPSYSLSEDEELVNHYMQHVLPVQYFFMEQDVVDQLRTWAWPTTQSNVFRSAICHVARVHQRRVREAGPHVSTISTSPTTSIYSHSSISTISTIASNSTSRSPGLPDTILPIDVEEDRDEYFEQIRSELISARQNLQVIHALAGLQAVSSVLFAGGIGDWKPFLEIACTWVGTILQCATNGDPHAVIGPHRRRLVEAFTGPHQGLEKFIINATMWFEVLASVTEIRKPKFLDYYIELFDGRFEAVDEEVEETDGPISMLKDWGCDNATFLAIAKISDLAAWKEEQVKAGKLSVVELVKRGEEIEAGLERQGRRLGRPGPVRREERGAGMSANTMNAGNGGIREDSDRDHNYGNINVLRGGGEEERQRWGCANDASSASKDTRPRTPNSVQDNLRNRRQISADIFHASAGLYLHTVLSGDWPKVDEIAYGVEQVVNAVRRIPWTTETKMLHGSVVRSSVFPICLAGCMTDKEEERGVLRRALEREGGAGNCREVLGVMEEVWRERDRLGGTGEVRWREILRERGVPLLLV